MTSYWVPEELAIRHWPGEATAVVRLPQAGTTHLVGAEALAVLQAAASCGVPADPREIAHALELDMEGDDESQAALQRIIDGLVQSGLLRQRLDDADSGREEPR